MCDLPESRGQCFPEGTQPRVAKSTGEGGLDKSGRLSAVHTSRPLFSESIQAASTGACSECRASVSTHKAVALWVLVCAALKEKKVNVLDVFLRNVGLLGIINFT